MPELNANCLCACIMCGLMRKFFFVHPVVIALRLLSPHLHKAKLHG